MFNDLDKPITVRKEKRTCTMHPISNFVSYEKLPLAYKAFATALTELNIPKNIREAPIQPEWKKAEMEEVNALKRNKTSEYIKLPARKKLMGCK